MLDNGPSQKEVIRPDFNRGIMIDFQGAKITSDVGFLLVREIDDRFRIIDPMKDCLEDLRSPTHTRHSLVQMVRQRVYQIAPGYEDCNECWSMGFMADELFDGRGLRLLTTVDNISSVSSFMGVGFRNKGYDFVSAPNLAAAQYGVPQRMQVDNGPEFISK